MRTLTPYFTKSAFNSGLFDEMDRFFDELKWPDASASRGGMQRTFAPACDVTEAQGHFLVSVDLPGVKKEDIKIELNDGVLTISGERKFERKSDEADRVQRFEKFYGSFQRTFTLPKSIATDKVEAHYENGVLDLVLPKVQAAKPRQIEIQSGEKPAGFFDKILGAKDSSKEA